MLALTAPTLPNFISLVPALKAAFIASISPPLGEFGRALSPAGDLYSYFKASNNSVPFSVNKRPSYKSDNLTTSLLVTSDIVTEANNLASIT